MADTLQRDLLFPRNHAGLRLVTCVLFGEHSSHHSCLVVLSDSQHWRHTHSPVSTPPPNRQKSGTFIPSAPQDY